MKIFRWLLLALLLVVVLASVAAGLTASQWINGPLPQVAGELRVAGLRDEVRIVRDGNGIPAIYARNLHDLMFAQGYTQAQDRWWQMEFSRHVGAGRLQELMGANATLRRTDVFVRKLGWYEAAERDFAAMGEADRAILQSFADGVNAYITSRPAGQLAFEYAILALRGVRVNVTPWTPLDTVVWTKVMAWDLSGNSDVELVRSAMIEAFGEEMTNTYIAPFPFDRHPTIIQQEDLPPVGEPFAPAPDTAGIIGLDADSVANPQPGGFALGRGTGIGSNNWVVAGSRTASGSPLLANDPHLGIGMPSIWYEIGLHCEPVSDECPYNVRGFAFAPSPLVIIGHNGQIGWGVTNVGWDTQDYYRIVINPENPLQYEWDGEWRDMTTREETIRYGDSDLTMTFTVRLTHLGPVMNDNEVNDDGTLSGFNNDTPLVLRWTASAEIGTVFQAVTRLNRATDWDSFRAALTLWTAPAQNFVYADTQGNIGYQAPGLVPVRAPGHTGMLPVDGTTSELEWRGYVPFENLPSVLNPERGYIATANQALVPFEYYAQLAETLADTFGADAHYVFGYEWAAGYRGQRIVDMLEASSAHDLETFRAIHGDNEFVMARNIAPFLNTFDMGSAEANDLRDWLATWDFQMHMDSAQAAFFGLFWRQLVTRAFNDQLAAVDRTATGEGHEMLAIEALLTQPENPWWDDTTTDAAVETRDEIVRAAFTAAVAEANSVLGADRAQWRWGRLHTATFRSNPLGQSGIAPLEALVNRGPVEASGGSEIVNATGWELSSYAVRSLPSLRMVLDFSDLTRSQTNHSTGQSGHPSSPHYGDFIEDWRMIRYHPMLFSTEQVTANAASTLVLRPQ